MAEWAVTGPGDTDGDRDADHLRGTVESTSAWVGSWLERGSRLRTSRAAWLSVSYRNRPPDVDDAEKQSSSTGDTRRTRSSLRNAARFVTSLPCTVHVKAGEDVSPPRGTPP